MATWRLCAHGATVPKDFHCLHVAHAARSSWKPGPHLIRVKQNPRRLSTDDLLREGYPPMTHPGGRPMSLSGRRPMSPPGDRPRSLPPGDRPRSPLDDTRMPLAPGQSPHASRAPAMPACLTPRRCAHAFHLGDDRCSSHPGDD
ncbi:hypothetical protein VNO80_31202 [Phaseolus coccineus]|uniref:Uncharacterized protein n=1 Tax=Phaseolus coccineus TaxID=3886 RepID=A0AAN9L8Q2_PHACN